MRRYHWEGDTDPYKGGTAPWRNADLNRGKTLREKNEVVVPFGGRYPLGSEQGGKECKREGRNVDGFRMEKPA